MFYKIMEVGWVSGGQRGSGSLIYSHSYVYLQLLTFDAICHVGAENGSRSGGAAPQPMFPWQPTYKEVVVLLFMGKGEKKGNLARPTTIRTYDRGEPAVSYG